MFLAEIALPSALQMSAATQTFAAEGFSTATAYSIAFDTISPFESAYSNRGKLQRQWSAYQHWVGDADDNIIDLLSRLDWDGLGNACIVDVGLLVILFSPISVGYTVSRY